VNATSQSRRQQRTAERIVKRPTARSIVITVAVELESA